MEQNNVSPTEKALTGKSDLLAELANEATEKTKALDFDDIGRKLRSAKLDATLQDVFRFFDLFVNHVNVIKPVIPRIYGQGLQATFDTLKWVSGFVDYRRQSMVENALFDHVLLRIGLTNSAPVTMKRRWHQLDILRKELFRAGLRPVDDLDALERNLPRQEYLEIEVEPEFQLRLHFQGNYETGEVDLHCANLIDFDILSFTLKPDEIDINFLEALGRYLIGRDILLPKLLRQML